MTRMMAIVVLAGLCALSAGCASSSQARVAPGENAIKYRPKSVAQKFAEFAKQGWTVTSKELENQNKPKAIAGTNGMIMQQDPYAKNNSKANPLNNAVWSTNFRVDDPKSKKMEGVNIVQNGGAGAVNVVNGQGGRQVAADQGVNVVGPAGSSVKGNIPQNGKGGVQVNGPAGTGSANLGTNNGLPTVGTVNVMGPDGKVHSVRRDLGKDVQHAEQLVPPVLSH